MKKDESKENEQIVFYQGQGGGPPPPPDPRDPQEVDEGVLNQKENPNAASQTFDRAVSLTKIRVSDLLSEGEIQGLVTGYYNHIGLEGQTGYYSSEFIKNPGVALGEGTYYNLQSVYLNDVPLVDGDGKFNFQQINFTESKGGPTPSEETQITNPDGNGLSIVRRIGERLRGPNIIVLEDGSTQVDPDVGEDTFSKYYRILNKFCSRAQVNIRFNALRVINKTGPRTNPPGAPAGKGFGDTKETEVEIEIFSRKLFSNAEGNNGTQGYTLKKAKTIKGKISQGYIQAIPFDTGLTQEDLNNPTFMGFEIKVRRLTSDSINSDRTDQSVIDSLIEYYEDQYGYPNSAIVSCKFEAEYFSSIPTRTYEVDLLKVKIPSNYDPITRKYTGSWDGTFATEKKWSDNPAWCFYDLLTNKRYGLGEQIQESLVDKWTLYEIAQYCDEMVSDGKGGYEPRFSCDLYFNDRLDAYTALQDFASIFRGLIYYAGGSIRAFQDKPSDPIHTFTNANVEGGNFKYQSSSRKSRFNTIAVRYNDRNNDYTPSIEVIEDIDGIRRNGVIRKEVTAFGITRKSQAQRLGRWVISTDNLETETMSFGAGIEAALLEPGDVVRIADNTKTSKRHGGRIKNISATASETQITLDSEIPLSGAETYEFSLLTPTYQYDPALVTGLTSNDVSGIDRSAIQSFSFAGSLASGVTGADNIVRTQITTNDTLNISDYEVSGVNVFTIHSSGEIDKNPDELYRVISVAESEPASKYDVQCIIYKPEKYTKVDNSTKIENTNIYAIPDPPNELIIGDVEFIQNTEGENSKFSQIPFTVILPDNSLSGIKSVAIYAKKSGIGDGGWIGADFSQRGGVVVDATPDSEYLINILPATGERISSSYAPLEDGTYLFRAYSRNPISLPSNTSVSGFKTIDQAPIIQNIIISDLTLETQTGSNNPADKTGQSTDILGPSFSWNSSLAQTTLNLQAKDLLYRFTVREPSGPDSNLPSPVIYFEQTGLSLNENALNFSYEQNLSGIAVIATNGRDYPDYENYVFPRTDLPDNVQTFNVKNGKNGPFRNYDVVIEAHDLDGNSSVGYNFVTDAENSGENSVFSQSLNANKGYDILQVRNPAIPQIIMTPDVHLTNAKASIVAEEENSFLNPYSPDQPEVFDDFNFNFATSKILGANTDDPTNYVTQQFLNFNGDIELKIFRDEDGETNYASMNGINDTAGAIVYYSDIWFNGNDVKQSGFTQDAYGDYTLTGYTGNRPTVPSEFPIFASRSEPFTGTITKVATFVNKNDAKAKEKITIPAQIFSKEKYVAITLLDSFEAEKAQKGLTTLSSVMDNAKNFEVSPAILIKRKGEPDARSIFRAYLKLECVTQANNALDYRYDGYYAYNLTVNKFNIYSFGLGEDFVVTSINNAEVLAYYRTNGGKPQDTLNRPEDTPTKVTIEGSLLESIPLNSRLLFTNGKFVTTEQTTDNKIKFSIDATLTPDRETVTSAENWERAFVRGGNYRGYTRAFTNYSNNYTYTLYDYYKVTIEVNQNVTADIMTVGILWNGLNGPTAQVTPEPTL